MPAILASIPNTAEPLVLAGMSRAWNSPPIRRRSEAGLIGRAASSLSVNPERSPPFATMSPKLTERFPANTFPFRAMQEDAGAPSIFAPASIRAIRPAAPAWLRKG